MINVQYLVLDYTIESTYAAAVELRQVRYFVAVAEELHFTRAAARLNVAQPSLSYQIRELERDLDIELFARGYHNVRLTEAGSAFLEEARLLLTQADRAREAARSAEHGHLGALNIGFIAMAAHEVMPRITRAFRERHPRVTLGLRELSITEQIESLGTGDLDVGLLHLTFTDDRLELALLRREPLVTALPEDHRLASRRRLRLADLEGERFILGSHGPPTGFVAHLRRLCRDAGFKPRVVQEAGGAIPQLGLVAAGVGIAVLPESVERLRTPHVVFRPLHDRSATVDFVAAWRKDRRSRATDEFVAISRAVTSSSF